MRFSLRMVAGPALVAALFLAPEVSFEHLPPPAETGSLELDVPAGSTAWLSPPLRVEATAAGLSWEDAPAEAWIRASADGTHWGPWVDLHADPDHGPDPGGSEAAASRGGSDPVWVGRARFIQYRIEGRGVDLHAEYVETAGRNLSAWERVELFFNRIALGRRAPAVAQPDQPAMVSREEWGGAACVADKTPDRDYAERVEMLFIHHTDHGSNSNGYGPGEGKDLVYAICSYHVNVRQWSDIGYNFLVDKYGTMYEGRGGGIEAGVIGAHTGGFNSYSTGIAFIGDHTASAPTDAAQAALRRLAAWKLDIHHVDPFGTVTVESYGSTRYPEGTIVQLPTVAGHRDASITACPGGACYALLDWFKNGIAAEGGPKIYGGWPDQDPIEGSPEAGYQPATFAVRFSEPMNWTLSISDLSGTELRRQEGTGPAASVVWDGSTQGVPQPVARYRVSVTGLPLGGTASPRPAVFEFRLGSFLPPFEDDEGSDHELDIIQAWEAGLTQGCGPTTFCPKDDVTRWQMALFLTRTWTALGYDLPDGADQGFADIAGRPTAEQAAVNQLAQLGITTGTSPTAYNPEGRVTRQQMALFLTRLWSLGPYDLPAGIGPGFTDIVTLPVDIQMAINQLAELGITNGTTPTTYNPGGIVTREQMASFLVRTMHALGWTLEAT